MSAAARCGLLLTNQSETQWPSAGWTDTQLMIAPVHKINRSHIAQYVSTHLIWKDSMFAQLSVLIGFGQCLESLKVLREERATTHWVSRISLSPSFASSSRIIFYSPCIYHILTYISYIGCILRPYIWYAWVYHIVYTITFHWMCREGVNTAIRMLKRCIQCWKIRFAHMTEGWWGDTYNPQRCRRAAFCS